VSFEYEPQRVALRNVSFEVKPGQKAVLAGPSGSGKSTIASLLLRLHDPCEGRILIDGKDIRSYTLESLRSQISIVMQDSPLFDSMKASAPCDRVDLVALTTKARKKGAELCGL
jgi:ATP-binding cassette subfamily B protein